MMSEFYRAFTGIGSREIAENHEEVEYLIEKICNITTNKGFTLRSGHAKCIDQWFEKHHKGPQEIYLPYEGFEGSKSQLFHLSDDSLHLAKKFHPAPNMLNSKNIRYIARNGYQVLGYELNYPSEFVVCYTNSPEKGGTSHALRIAAAHDIPVFNLYFEKDIISLSHYLKTL